MTITARRMLGITLAALVVAGVLAASTEAKTNASPPLGRYNCYQYSPSVGYLPQGWFRLLTLNRYVLNTKERGRYSYASRTRRVNFSSGAYRRYGWVGEFLPRGREGRRSPTIVLTERVPKDRIKIHCYWQARG